MSRISVTLLALVTLIPAVGRTSSGSAQTQGGPDIEDTRLLGNPALSATHVAFNYAGDLWTARLDGSEVRRLTTHVGNELNPRFSPNGRWIAFSGQYDGNLDLYVVPATGGEPRRLTWHPGPDVVQGFTPDGSAVLFISARAVHTNRHTQLFTVPLQGGMPEQLPIPNAFKATYSEDGTMIAYVPLNEPFNQWKNYRGGLASRIWLYDTRDHSVQEIPRPEGRSNDTDPMWIGGRVFFRSDRNGEFNIFAFDPAGSDTQQLTSYEDFPVLSAAHGAGQIVYEQAGYLHLLDPGTGSSTKLTIGVAADLPETRARFADGADWIRSASVSPHGARAVFEFRGEIVTVPAEHGDPRNLTETTGAHERSPAWSPDGDHVAYISDVNGEYQLHIAPQDAKGEARVLPLQGAGFYEDLKWSPDGSMISYTDNSWSLYFIDLESGRARQVSAEPYYGPVKTLHHAWSPDSRWIAHTKINSTYFRTVYLYSVDEDRSYPVTEGLSDVAEPVFDRGGKYLYFAASTDAGPVLQWFAQSNQDMEATNALYVAVLEKETPSPLAPRSDEEEGGDEEVDEPEEAQEEPAEVEVQVDFEGLDQRVLALPLDEAFFGDLQPGPEGSLYYRKQERSGPFGRPGGSSSLNRFTFQDREETELLANVSAFHLTADGKKVLLRSGEGWWITDAGGEIGRSRGEPRTNGIQARIDPSEGKLNTDGIQVRIDPRAEWAQIFDEAWRINRDFFYDPGMHGADWPAMREKYRPFLQHVTTRSDLNLVMQWMFSELAVGHHRVGGGDVPNRPETVPGGLLGADYEAVNGRYRFAKIYGGLNWNPDLRSPLTEPGVEVQPGEYLLAVNGKEIRFPDNLYRHFENTAEKIIEITVGPNADGRGSRTVRVVPIRNEGALRNRDWIEGNISKVTEATDGRVAYVYVPNTATAGHEYFKRYFFPQADRDAVIIDERYNGGGLLADYYIDILRRPYVSHWATRYGQDIKTPIASIQGPRAMIIDETAGSGGDLLPWMFRKFELGPLIGKRTWGGLVGVLGFPVLMDGGGVTAPNLAIWTQDGFIVENVGVPPDIEVEQLPAEVIAGRDPQLERAIEWILEQLEANPPREPVKPDFPRRARR
jgi:tricorn protease